MADSVSMNMFNLDDADDDIFALGDMAENLNLSSFDIPDDILELSEDRALEVLDKKFQEMVKDDGEPIDPTPLLSMPWKDENGEFIPAERPAFVLPRLNYWPPGPKGRARLALQAAKAAREKKQKQHAISSDETGPLLANAFGNEERSHPFVYEKHVPITPTKPEQPLPGTNTETPRNNVTANNNVSQTLKNNIPSIQDSLPKSPRETSPERSNSVSVTVTKPAPVKVLRKRPSFALGVTEDQLQTIYENEDDDTETESCCPRCPCSCPKSWKMPKTRRPKLPKSLSDIKSKGTGMTASELPGEKYAFPGLSQLVANYARMLQENKPNFIETLFRAVKLDKLDVLKILTKIATKSGYKLSSPELREPESSATILHVALLYNHVDIVKFFLESRDPDLILAKYTKEEYRNQTGLHVAVANGNNDIVEMILEALESPAKKHELVNTVANGNYFKTKHPDGQLCLTTAAWAGNAELIKLLVKYGANLAKKNHDGNTLLHSIVIQSVKYPDRLDYLDMVNKIYDSVGVSAQHMTYAVKSAKQKKLEQIKMQNKTFKYLLNIPNNDGHTPMTLAVTIGSQLFRHIINMEKIFKIPQNKLGSIAWVTYDVSDITTYAYGNYNKFSILHILAHNSQHLSRHASLDQGDQDVDFLDVEPIKSITTCKWLLYRWIYLIWFIIHFLYMIMLTAATTSVNSSPLIRNISNIENEIGTVSYGYVFFLPLPAVYIILEILDLFGNLPYRIFHMSDQNYLKRAYKCVLSEWTITGNGPYRMVCFAFSIFEFLWFFHYCTKDDKQDMALSMALLLGWIFVLFFTRGCRVTCRFSIMIQKMFFRDLIYFLTVYVIVLVGFSFAMNALFTYLGDPEITISKVFYDMMNVVTDLDNKQTIDAARHPLFGKLLLILYAIVAVILLMNMLIAMMNTSYETVRVTRCNLWKQQELSIMLMIERRFFWWRWLCNKSESDVWRKEWEDEERVLLDVTELHTKKVT